VTYLIVCVYTALLWCPLLWSCDHLSSTHPEELDRMLGIVAEEEEIEEIIKENAMCAEECEEEDFEIDPHDENKICYGRCG